MLQIAPHIDREHILSPTVIVAAQELLDIELATIPALDYNTARGFMLMHVALAQTHLQDAREFDGWTMENPDVWATKDNYHVALYQSSRILYNVYLKHCKKVAGYS